jgi:hypothetical protein
MPEQTNFRYFQLGNTADLYVYDFTNPEAKPVKLQESSRDYKDRFYLDKESGRPRVIDGVLSAENLEIPTLKKLFGVADSTSDTPGSTETKSVNPNDYVKSLNPGSNWYNIFEKATGNWISPDAFKALKTLNVDHIPTGVNVIPSSNKSSIQVPTTGLHAPGQEKSAGTVVVADIKKETSSIKPSPSKPKGTPVPDSRKLAAAVLKDEKKPENEKKPELILVKEEKPSDVKTGSSNKVTPTKLINYKFPSITSWNKLVSNFSNKKVTPKSKSFLDTKGNLQFKKFAAHKIRKG